MRALLRSIAILALVVAIPVTAHSQPNLVRDAPSPPERSDTSATRGPFLLAAAATFVPVAIGLHQATRESPFSGDEPGVWAASGGLIFGPTLGYVAVQDWRGAVQGTTIRLLAGGVAAWIASEQAIDAGFGGGELAAIPAAFGGMVAVLDLYDLYHWTPPTREGRISVVPSYDPDHEQFMLLARRSF